MHMIPVILAGGSGERLWPLSKVDYPKQFVSFDSSGLSLFQNSILRVADRALFSAPIVVCNEAHRFIVSEQLRAIGSEAILLVEPVARNTAPALALAALHASELGLTGALLVMPSDHQIDDSAAFLAAITRGARAAERGMLVTLAMTPHAPETGYGYIRMGEALDDQPGVHRIAEFVEKPNRATAESYLASGNYGWNSGIFLMSAATVIESLARYAPAMLEACKTAYANRKQEAEFLYPQKEALLACPSDSIDYALMEHTDRGAVIPVEMGWCDLGSWTSLHDISEKDSNGNAISGPAVIEDTHGCYIRTHNALIATIGLRDLVIVSADNAVMIGPKNRMQEIKTLLKHMRERLIPDINLTAFSHRPWGRFYSIDRGAHYQVKKLHLKPGGKISLQSHSKRSEHWIVVEGRATVTNGDAVTVLEENQSTYIPAGAIHRLENRETTDLVVIEVQTGSYLGEDDITRFEDVYNRC